MTRGTVAVAVGLLIVASGCTEGTAPEAPDPTASATEARTEPTDYSDLSSAMNDWTDLCAVVDLSPPAAQFEADPIVPKTRRLSDGGLSCSSTLKRGPSFVGDIAVWLTPYDTDLAAAEEFEGKPVTTPHALHGIDSEVTVERDLDPDSPWLAGGVSAYETAGPSSEEMKGAYAVVLGDFYIVVVYTKFYPDEALRADCEPSAEDDCLMTATEMADFFADEYLDEVYESIETELGRL